MSVEVVHALMEALRELSADAPCPMRIAATTEAFTRQEWLSGDSVTLPVSAAESMTLPGELLRSYMRRNERRYALPRKLSSWNVGGRGACDEVVVTVSMPGYTTDGSMAVVGFSSSSNRHKMGNVGLIVMTKRDAAWRVVRVVPLIAA